MSYHPAASTSAPARLGRYELLGQLATGGMAEIHLARLAGEAGFEKLVVVKRLLPELVGSRAFVAMFLDEGKLVARLDHPNICEVHELGKDGGDYFLVMPYLSGVPVTALIARPRDPDRTAQLRVAAGVIAQACAGLHHAHELTGADGAPLHLVHRDVSPSNLFVTTSGVVKVLDFGIAKVRGAAETEVGTVKGKSEYMAPEQILGEPLDRRCDVFALGIVLFELATHQRLFKRGSEYLAARAILEEPIPRADEVDPAIPTALADVIARALSRAPSDRFPDARALSSALSHALAPATADEIAAALTAGHGDQLTAQRTRQLQIVHSADSRLQTSPVSRPRRRRLLLPALLATLVGGLGVFIATRPSAPPPSAPSSPPPLSPSAPPPLSPSAPPPSSPPPAASFSLPPSLQRLLARVPLSRRQLTIVASVFGAILVIGIIASLRRTEQQLAPRPAVAARPAARPDAASPAPDPSAGILAEATRLLATGDRDGALSVALGGLRGAPDSAPLAALVGRIYFEKLYWRDGIRYLRQAIARDPQYRTDPDVIKAVVRGFNTTPDVDDDIERFLREDLGSAAVPALQDTARAHPNAKIRARAQAELRRIR